MDRSRVVFTVVGIALAGGLVLGALTLRSSTEVLDPSAPAEPSTAPATPLTQTTAAYADITTTVGPPTSGPDDDCTIFSEVDASGITSTTVVKCSEMVFDSGPTTVPPSGTATFDSEETLPPEPPTEETPACHFATTIPGGTLPSPQCDEQ